MAITNDVALRKDTQKSIAQLMAGDWGLMTCLPQHKCRFCKAYKENEDSRRQYRNLFLMGLPEDLLCKTLDPTAQLTATDVHDHAFRQSWQRNRRLVATERLSPEAAQYIVLQRLAKAWDVVGESTADKMVEHALRLAGIGQKVDVASTVTVSWEKTVTQAQGTDADATITLDDTEFTEVELPSLEEPRAPTD